MRPAHRVARIDPVPALEHGWSSPAWRDAPALEIASFHPQSSAHRPRARARLARGSDALCAIFRVEDRYVRGAYTGYQDPVHRDSCVELFVQPRPDRGYFNLELGCAGGVLLSYIEDPRRTPDGFERWTPLPPDLGRRVRARTSLRGPIPDELAGPLDWEISARLPWDVLEPYAGSAAPRPGDRWRANLYKCADDSSHPHWASWAPIGERLDFHQPDRFGELIFD